MYPDFTNVVFIAFWFFLPGIFFGKVVSSVFKIKFSLLYMFIAGGVIWLYLFLFGAVLSGLLGGILEYFRIISIFGFVLSLVSIAYLIIRIKAIITQRKFFLNLFSFTVYIHVFLLIALGIFLILFHHIWLESDAVAVFLPQAKGVIITRSIIFNPFDYSTANMMSYSGIYIMYACVLYILPTLDAIRILPVFYYLFGIISLYLLAHELFGSKKAAITTLIVYISFISTMKTIAQYSLYADLPFVFLLTSAILFLTKWVKERRDFWLIMCGIALSLLPLFKPYGYIIISAFMGSLVLFTKIRLRKFLAVLIALVPIHLETFSFIVRPWILMNFSPTYTNDVMNLLFRWGPSLLLSLSIALIIRKRSLPNLLKTRTFPIFLLSFAPLVLYLAYYFFAFNLLLLPNPLLTPSLERMFVLYYKIIPRSSVDLTVYYRWDSLFYEGLAGPYLIPLLLGAYVSVKQLNIDDHKILTYLPSLFTFVALFVLWTYLGAPNDVRRLFLLSPFFALVIAQGVLSTIRLLKVSKEYGLVAFAIFNSLVLGYLWSCYEGIELISLRTFGFAKIEWIDYYVLATFFLLTMAGSRLLHLAMEKANKLVARKNWSRRVFRTTGILLVLGLLSQAIIINGINSYTLSTQVYNNNFNDPASIEHFYQVKDWDTKYLLGDFTRVISYFEKLNDSYTVLGFYIHYLKLFANRTVIDLTWPYGYEQFGNIFTLNRTEALEELYKNNIRYILIPKSNHPLPLTYQTYLNAKVTFPFLNSSDEIINDLLEGQKYILTPLREFTSYELYTIKEVAYPFTLYPLIFDHDDYIQIPTSANLDITDAVTVEAWIYMDVLPSVAGKHFEITGKQWNVLRFYISKENAKLAVTQMYGETTYTDFGNTALQPGRWYHVAYTYDASSLKIYINSLQDQSISRAGAIGTNTFPLLIHGFRNDGWFGADGLIAAIRIYSRALSQDEIVWNYGDPGDPIRDNLVLWFKFDEGDGNILHDASRNNNDGIIYGARWPISK